MSSTVMRWCRKSPLWSRQDPIRVPSLHSAPSLSKMPRDLCSTSLSLPGSTIQSDYSVSDIHCQIHVHETHLQSPFASVPQRLVTLSPALWDTFQIDTRDRSFSEKYLDWEVSVSHHSNELEFRVSQSSLLPRHRYSLLCGTTAGQTRTRSTVLSTQILKMSEKI